MTKAVEQIAVEDSGFLLHCGKYELCSLPGRVRSRFQIKTRVAMASKGASIWGTTANPMRYGGIQATLLYVRLKVEFLMEWMSVCELRDVVEHLKLKLALRRCPFL